MDTTRRSFLSAAAAVSAAGALPAGASAAIAPVGSWSDDDDGLPAYLFSADLPVVTKDGSGAPFPLPGDPYFLLGNYRLTLFAHASGLYRLMTGERAWAVANSPSGNQEGSGATINLDGKTIKLTGAHSLAEKGSVCKRRFGTGYCAYDYAVGDGVFVRRTISVPPSPTINVGTPAAVITVTLTNRSSRTRSVTYIESLLVNYVTVAEHFTPLDGRHLSYSNTVSRGANHLVAAVSATSQDPTALAGRNDASRYDAFPPSVVLAIRSQSGVSVALKTYAVSTGDVLAIEAGLALKPHETRTVILAVGVAPDGDPATVLSCLEAVPDKNGACYRQGWRDRLPDLSAERDTVLRREMVWNSYVVEAMATYSAFYGETFIPQGMTYDYELDLSAAPRDHLQHALAACYTNPALAKSAIRFVLCGMTSNGELRYTRGGYGATSNGAWSTSDQQLYVFQAVAEYLRITGDYAFLDEKSSFLPREARYEGSTIEKLTRAFTYLRDEVGTGEHGLIKLLNSDWCDMIYTEAPVLLYFGSAESHMNSAMAMAVIPALVQQLEAARSKIADRAGAGKLIQALSRYQSAIRVAFYKDLGDRSFSRRLYFKPDMPFGDEELHLEPQIFLLQCDDFPVERKHRLLDEIRRRVQAGEALGPRQRETPQKTAAYLPGTAENGGFWYSLTGQMILGVNGFDPDAAYLLLRQMTFDNFSRHFPGYWPGQWSAPDTLSSKPSGRFEGLPRPGDDFFWLSSPVYCAHAHAWPLYAYRVLRGR